MSFCFVVTLWDYTILLNQYHCKVHLHSNTGIRTKSFSIKLH